MNNIEYILSITYNPFFLKDIVLAFISGFSEKNGKNPSLFILYLVLPIILYKSSRDKLKKARSDSSIRTLFINDGKQFTSIGGLQDRYVQLKKMTNEAIIIAANDKQICIDNELYIMITEEARQAVNKKLKSEKEYLRAAKYLGVSFAGIDVKDIYFMLGVYPI